MEVGSEISQKIRSAIKAKLLELGAYVDDELPEYIMVMVANKRSRPQMNNDLCLFLGAHTAGFTEWLHGLLGKLQTIKADTDKSGDTQGKVKLKVKNKGKTHIGKTGKKDNNEKKKNNVRNTDGVAKKKIANASGKKSEDLKKLQPGNNSKDGEGHVGKEKQYQDPEDIIQPASTDASGDAEFETAEFTNSKAVSLMSSLISGKSYLSSPSTNQISNQEKQLELSTISRKRKASTSGLSDGSEDGDEACSPVVDSVLNTSIYTAFNSSVPSSLQVNRASLLKAMTETEHSIALKRKVAQQKLVSQPSFAIEDYSPKQKLSYHSHEDSLPLYIPSPKKYSFQDNKNSKLLPLGEALETCKYMDAKPALSLDDCRKLISKYHSKEIIQTVSISEDLSHQSEKSNDKHQKPQTRSKNFTYGRVIQSDHSSNSVKNFKITTYMMSPDLQSISDYHSKIQQYSSKHGVSSELQSISDLSCSKFQEYTHPLEPKQVTLSPSSKESRISVTARLGKVVVERKYSAEGEGAKEALYTRVRYPKPYAELRDTNERQCKVTEVSRKSNRIISSWDKVAAQIQHKVHVNSEHVENISKKGERHSIPDSNIVPSDTCTQSGRENSADNKITGCENQVRLTRTSRQAKEIQGVSVRTMFHECSDNEDLANMIDKDPAHELHETLDDKLASHHSHEDINNTVAGNRNVMGINKDGKTQERSGIRFIVTLDGVDEKQFGYEDKSNTVSKNLKLSSKSVPVTPALASDIDQMQPKMLDLLVAKGKAKSLMLLKTAETLKLTSILSNAVLPKTEPFSICLKDSSLDSSGKGCYKTRIAVMEDSGMSALKRARMSERCKFWPVCAAGNSCEYHHPTERCKVFPSCKFGDKCLFFHPNCRYDAKCARPDCPFTHTSHRQVLTSTTHIVSIPKPHFVFTPVLHKPHLLQSSFPNTQTTCRFFPSCHNITCPFLHPTPCKFGASCRSPACTFYHPPAHGKDKLKWQAHITPLRQHMAALLVPGKTELAISRLLKGTKPRYSTTVSSTSK